MKLGYISKLLLDIRNPDILDYLFHLLLRQMNFGNGGKYSDSGELTVASYIRGILKGESTVVIFDVGANVGNYSRSLSGIFGSIATIFSFEISEYTYGVLLERTKDFGNIIPCNLGFSDRIGSGVLFTDRLGSGLASIYKRKLDHFGILMDRSEDVKLTTIDSYCADSGIERIHFLKLDIEGHELSALMGARGMINNGRIDFIQFEFGGCNIDSRTYFQDFYYLLKDRYRIYRVLRDGLYELPAYKETYEIFITTNYLAVRKD